MGISGFALAPALALSALVVGGAVPPLGGPVGGGASGKSKPESRRIGFSDSRLLPSLLLLPPPRSGEPCGAAATTTDGDGAAGSAGAANDAAAADGDTAGMAITCAVGTAVSSDATTSAIGIATGRAPPAPKNALGRSSVCTAAI